jgi:4-amino-4-deoxy-L-arabinose transferase-like glycosyltransferase
MTREIAQPLRPATPMARTLRFGTWLNENARTIAFTAVGLSLVIGVGYSLVLGGELRYFDEQVYVTLTRYLAHGHGFTLDGVQPTAYRPPGYAFILLPVYLVSGGSILAMRMVGVLALTGTVWFSYLVGRRVHSPATGALAAFVVACYPLLIYTATTLYPQVPALFMVLVMIETGMCALPADGVSGRRRALMAVIAGLVGGLLTLAVPTFGLTVVALILWLVWRQWRVARRVAWRTVAVLIVATAILPATWATRNAVQLHALVPVSTNQGVNLLLGNSPHATAGSSRDTDISSYEAAAVQRKFSEVELDRFYTQQAVLWIKDNPGRAALLFVEKAADNFNYTDHLVTTSQQNGTQDLISGLTYYPILALALLRILLFRRFPLHPTEKMLLGVIVLNVLVLSVFYTRIRFRVPLDGFTIILAAGMVTQFLSRHNDKQPQVAE